MNDLIQLAARQVGDDTVQTASARDLHAFLEVGKDFSTWIKGRIEQYGFVEAHDFVSFDAAPQNGGAGNRGHRVEFAISLDMAKELAMVERNEKGRQARLYFIDCERRAKTLMPTIPQTMPEALRLAAQAMEDAQTARAAQVEAEVMLQLEAKRSGQLEAQVAESAPKAAALDRISAGDEALTMTQVAKMLDIKRDSLTKWMHANGWVYRQNGVWVAYDRHIKNGRLQFKESKYTDEKTGQVCRKPYCHILPKGFTRLAEVFSKEAVA